MTSSVTNIPAGYESMFSDEPGVAFSAPNIELENVRIARTYTPADGFAYHLERYQDRDELLTVGDIRELIPTLQKLVDDADYFNASTNAALLSDIESVGLKKCTIDDIAKMADKHEVCPSMIVRVMGY